MKRIFVGNLPWQSRAASQNWGLILMGLCSATGVLLLYQVNWQAHVEGLQQQWFNRLEGPYQYPFTAPKTSHQLMATLNQEIAFYLAQVRARPDSALDLAALATAYLQAARLTGEGSWYLLADQVAQQSLTSLPFNNTEAMVILARVAEARHDFAAALQLADQIPDERQAVGIRATANLALGQLPEAAAAAQRLVDLNPSQSSFTTLALVEAAQGQTLQAQKSLQAGLSVEEWGETSSSARTRTLLGRLYYEQGQLDQAEALYQEALRILPGYPPALLNLAQLHLRQGQYRAATGFYRRLEAAQSPASGAATVYTPLVLRGQARIAEMQGRPEQARQLWQAAEALLQPAPADEFSLGHRRDLARLLLERQAPGDLAQALSLMQAEVARRRDAETLQTYGMALAQAERWTEAQAILQEALASGVQRADLFYQAAQVEQALGQAAQAEVYFQKALAVDPSFDEAARRALDLGVGLGS